MDDLKKIWQQVGDLKVEVGDLIKMDKVESIYTQLKKEEARQKKWRPWIILYMLLITVGLFWVYNSISQNMYGRDLTTLQIIGTLLIPIGGFLMYYLIQLHKIPLDVYAHDQNSTAFLKIVKEKLGKRKKMSLIANGLYVLILTIGLNMISLDWGLDDFKTQWTPAFLLNGTMLLIGLASFYGSQKSFDKRYEDMLTKINRFLEN